jgi:hypothetical protein
MSLKSLQELHQDILFSLLALDDIGVSLGIVDSLNVVDVNEATAISVNLVESLTNQLLPEAVNGSSQDSDELIVVNRTISISIKSVKKHFDILVAKA